jgi:hypothetical protein
MDAVGLALNRVARRRLDGALAVERLAQRGDDAAQKLLAYGNSEHFAGGEHVHALAHQARVAQNNDARRLLLEVEHQAVHHGLGLDGALERFAVRIVEPHHLGHAHAREPPYLRYAVAGAYDDARVLGARRRFEMGDLILELSYEFVHTVSVR